MLVDTDRSLTGAHTASAPETCITPRVRMQAAGSVEQHERVCTRVRVSPSGCKRAATSTNKGVGVSLQTGVHRGRCLQVVSARACVRTSV